MKLETYAVFNSAGDLVRLVDVVATDADKQAKAGESVRPATADDKALAVAKRDAWRNSLPPPDPDPIDVLTEAIKAKHGLTDADLVAATARLRARNNARK
jgi:hypothetical protein